MALHTKVDGERLDGEYLTVSPLFAPDGQGTTVPKHRMPDRPMAPEMAYEIVHDELMALTRVVWRTWSISRERATGHGLGRWIWREWSALCSRRLGAICTGPRGTRCA